MRDVAIPVMVPAMNEAALALVRRVEDGLLGMPQPKIETHHVIHAGMYFRTVMIPAGLAITGALVKIPTVLTVSGDTVVWLGGERTRITGYAVLPAAAGRKQLFIALTDTYITMSFPTKAETVEEAEREFTEEFDRLASRRDGAVNVVTGDKT